MRVLAEEQETIIHHSRQSKKMTIYTTDTTYMTKLDKLYKCVKEDFDGKHVFAKTYEADADRLTFRTDPKFKPKYVPKKQISEEQKAKMREAAKKKREAKGV